MQIRTGKTCRAILKYQPSIIPTTSRGYQAKTNMLISLQKMFDFKDVMLRFTHEQKHRIVHASCLNISHGKA